MHTKANGAQCTSGVALAIFPRFGIAIRAIVFYVQRLTMVETIRGRIPLPLVRRTLHDHMFALSRLPRLNRALLGKCGGGRR